MKKNKLASLVLASAILAQTVLPTIASADEELTQAEQPFEVVDSQEENKVEETEKPKDTTTEEKQEGVNENVEQEKPEIKEEEKVPSNNVDKEKEEKPTNNNKGKQETVKKEQEVKPKNTTEILNKSHEEQVIEVEERQEEIDSAIENNTPLYGYFMSQEESDLVKFFDSRQEYLENLNAIKNKRSDINIIGGIKGTSEEEQKNKLYEDYLNGKYDPSKGYENRFTIYKDGFLLPVKNFKLTGLYTKDKPRLVFEVKKGDKIYAPINSKESKYDKKKKTLELKDGDTKVILTNIDGNKYKDIKAGNVIGKSTDDYMTMYIEKDGTYINPVLLVRNKIEQENQGFFGIPQMYQLDEKWGANPYGSMNISSAACGPSSISMAISYLTGQIQTPDDLTTVLGGASSPHFIDGVGSSFSIFPAAADYYNLNSDTLGNNVNAVVEELKKGRPVVLSMHEGYFTSGGHFVLATGLTKDGKIYVNDPASRLRGEDTYTPEFIASQMKNAFSFYRNGDENKYNEDKPEKVEDNLIACEIVGKSTSSQPVEKIKRIKNGGN